MKIKFPILAGIVCLILTAFRLAAADDFGWRTRVTQGALEVELEVPPGGHVYADTLTWRKLSGAKPPRGFIRAASPILAEDALGVAV